MISNSKCFLGLRPRPRPPPLQFESDDVKPLFTTHSLISNFSSVSQVRLRSRGTAFQGIPPCLRRQFHIFYVRMLQKDEVMDKKFLIDSSAVLCKRGPCFSAASKFINVAKHWWDQPFHKFCPVIQIATLQSGRLGSTFGWAFSQILRLRRTRNQRSITTLIATCKPSLVVFVGGRQNDSHDALPCHGGRGRVRLFNWYDYADRHSWI